MVDDQANALAFYTDVLGFVKKLDIPMGEARWLTVGSPEAPDIQLLLEPNSHPAGEVFQKALFDDGIPLTVLRLAGHPQRVRKVERARCCLSR